MSGHDVIRRVMFGKVMLCVVMLIAVFLSC